MNSGYHILRVGGLNISSSRFLDLLERDEVSKLIIIDFEQNAHFIDDLYKTANFFGYNHLLKKLEVRWIKSSLPSRIIRRLLARFGYLVPLKLSLRFFAPELLRTLGPNDYDIIWVGDNDFDYSNLLFYLSHKLTSGKFPFARSYKETRFVKKWSERYMLENSTALIFPHEGYISFFEKLYSFVPKNVSIADLDWRYSKLVDLVKNLPATKLSALDRRPHLCLLTGRAVCDTSEKRSGHRYYFVPIISELIKRGICVHMHAFRIVPSKKHGNVYQEIAKQTDLFRIEPPLRLTVYSDDYKILKRYDAGLLHAPVPETAGDLYEFQKINIPNRLYEYQIADVVPLVKCGTLPAVEQIIRDTNLGIIYQDYDDLASKLTELVKGNLKNYLEREKINDFANFTDVFLRAIEGW